MGEKPTKVDGPKFRLGDVVNVRNEESESWKVGTICEISPLVKVYTRDVDVPTVFKQICPPARRTFVLNVDVELFPVDETRPSEYLSKETTIEVVEFVNDWALLISPSVGWIQARKDGVKFITRVGPTPTAAAAKKTVEKVEVQ